MQFWVWHTMFFSLFLPVVHVKDVENPLILILNEVKSERKWRLKS